MIVTSNCLEHYDAPFDLVREHFEQCRALYILLVPLDEDPLDLWHRYRFTYDSFPAELAGFHLVERRRVAVDPLVWNGSQILAVYGSAEYMRNRRDAVLHANTELRRLRHANDYKDRVLASIQHVLQERERGIERLRGELKIERNRARTGATADH